MINKQHVDHINTFLDVVDFVFQKYDECFQHIILSTDIHPDYKMIANSFRMLDDKRMDVLNEMLNIVESYSFKSNKPKQPPTEEYLNTLLLSLTNDLIEEFNKINEHYSSLINEMTQVDGPLPKQSMDALEELTYELNKLVQNTQP